jgi:hypothetical protein
VTREGFREVLKYVVSSWLQDTPEKSRQHVHTFSSKQKQVIVVFNSFDRPLSFVVLGFELWASCLKET